MNSAEDSAPAVRRNSKIAAAFHSGLWSEGVFAIFIVAVVLAVYFPALRGTYVWDDEQWTTMLQPVLKDFTGLWKMWTDPSVLQQYFPVTGTTFWLDHQLWHDSTTAAHVENVLFHLASGLLFWKLLQKLKVPGARIAATIFAVHPVMVESVAWISERKNVVSMTLFLGAMLAYGRHVRFWEETEEPFKRRWGGYFVALVLFALALLAKISVFAMPPLLILIAWWKKGRLRWAKDILPALPFFALAIGFGLFISYWEKHHVGAEGKDFDLLPVERFLVAVRALWFYVEKLFWPAGFCPVVPRWQLDANFYSQDLWVKVTSAVVVLMVVLRKRIGRGPLAAIFFYVGSLFPVLGFMNAYGMIYTFVSYRWVYVPSLGLITLAGAGFAWLTERLPKTPALAALAVPLFPLAAVARKDAGIYRNSEVYWQTTLAGNPNCWVACYNLGNDRYNAERWDEAIDLYQRAVELRPRYTQAHTNLGSALMQVNKFNEAAQQFDRALRLEPKLSTAHYNLANCLLTLDRLDESAEQFLQCIALTPDFAEAHNNLAVVYYREGRVNDVLAEYRKVIELKPESADAHCNLAETLLQVNALRQALDEYESTLRLNPDQRTALSRLAWIRATAGEASIRDGEAALRLARHAEELAQGKDATVLRVLAAAFAENKQFAEAAAAARRAGDLPKLDEALREALQADVQRYELGLPTRN